MNSLHDHYIVMLWIVINQSFIIVPAPAGVRVTYPIREIIAGSPTDLNCTVELNPAVDVPVSVTTEWSGPARTMFLPNRIVPTDMINLTTYSSTITVNAVRNGSYTCTAIIDSGGITFGSTDITVGKNLPRNPCTSLFLYVNSFFLYSSPSPSSY